MPSLFGVNKTLEIAFIVVQKEFRRQNIGLALLAKLQDYSREAGIERLDSTINPNNPESIRLHQKAGFDVKDWKLATYEVNKSRTDKEKMKKQRAS